MTIERQMTDREISIVLEKIERKRCLSRLQALAEEKGEIPRMPFLLLRKWGRRLQYAGGFLLGCFIGIFALLVSFIVFVRLLHIGFLL
jgi:hypothetical protein